MYNESPEPEVKGKGKGPVKKKSPFGPFRFSLHRRSSKNNQTVLLSSPSSSSSSSSSPNALGSSSSSNSSSANTTMPNSSTSPRISESEQAILSELNEAFEDALSSESEIEYLAAMTNYGQTEGSFFHQLISELGAAGTYQQSIKLITNYTKLVKEIQSRTIIHNDDAKTIIRANLEMSAQKSILLQQYALKCLFDEVLVHYGANPDSSEYAQFKVLLENFASHNISNLTSHAVRSLIPQHIREKIAANSEHNTLFESRLKQIRDYGRQAKSWVASSKTFTREIDTPSTLLLHPCTKQQYITSHEFAKQWLSQQASKDEPFDTSNERAIDHWALKVREYFSTAIESRQKSITRTLNNLETKTVKLFFQQLNDESKTHLGNLGIATDALFLLRDVETVIDISFANKIKSILMNSFKIAYNVPEGTTLLQMGLVPTFRSLMKHYDKLEGLKQKLVAQKDNSESHFSDEKITAAIAQLENLQTRIIPSYQAVKVQRDTLVAKVTHKKEKQPAQLSKVYNLASKSARITTQTFIERNLANIFLKSLSDNPNLVLTDAISEYLLNPNVVAEPIRKSVKKPTMLKPACVPELSLKPLIDPKAVATATLVDSPPQASRMSSTSSSTSASFASSSSSSSTAESAATSSGSSSPATNEASNAFFSLPPKRPTGPPRAHSDSSLPRFAKQ